MTTTPDNPVTTTVTTCTAEGGATGPVQAEIDNHELLAANQRILLLEATINSLRDQINAQKTLADSQLISSLANKATGDITDETSKLRRNDFGMLGLPTAPGSVTDLITLPHGSTLYSDPLRADHSPNLNFPQNAQNLGTLPNYRKPTYTPTSVYTQSLSHVGQNSTSDSTHTDGRNLTHQNFPLNSHASGVSEQNRSFSQDYNVAPQPYGTPLPVAKELRFQPLWETTPEFWFEALEHQFALRHVTDDNEKFFALISNVGPKVIGNLGATFAVTPAHNKYQFAKQAILHKFSESETQRANRFFQSLSMGSRTPSEYFNVLLDAGRHICDRASIFKIWSQRIPPYLSVLINMPFDIAQEESILKRADQIHADFQRQQVQGTDNLFSTNNFSINAIESRHDDNANIKSLLEQIHGLLSKQSNFRSRSRSVSRQRSNSSGKRAKSKDSSKRDNSQSKVFCYYHRNFSVKARKCEQPCDWVDHTKTDSKTDTNNNKSPSKNI